MDEIRRVGLVSEVGNACGGGGALLRACEGRRERAAWQALVRKPTAEAGEARKNPSGGGRSAKSSRGRRSDFRWRRWEHQKHGPWDRKRLPEEAVSCHEKCPA